MRGMRGERGFTLVEVLLVSGLFLVVLTATMTTMTAFERNNRSVQRNDDQVERVRRTIERGARQLRNLAGRPATGAATINRAQPHDFVFQTSDPSRTWVRYCAETQANGVSKLWSLANPAPVAATTTACPGTAADWPKRDLVAQNVTNRTNGRDEPLFTYARTCLPAAPASCATDLTSITQVNMEVLLDDNPARQPAEVRVGTGVFLRNQNEKPVAKFSARPSAISRTVLLNASESVDPEGRTLVYYWFRTDNYVPFTCGTKPQDGTLLGQGVTLNYKFPPESGPAGTVKNITLVVCDPGDLQSTYQMDVTIPT